MRADSKKAGAVAADTVLPGVGKGFLLIQQRLANKKTLRRLTTPPLRGTPPQEGNFRRCAIEPAPSRLELEGLRAYP